MKKGIVCSCVCIITGDKIPPNCSKCGHVVGILFKVSETPGKL